MRRLIKTKRLILREFTLDDAEDLFEFASKDEVSKYMSWDSYKSIQDAKENIIEWQKRAQENRRYIKFAIVLRENNKVIGMISTPRFYKNRYPEIAYCLSPDYWNKGYMTEALRRFTQYLGSFGYVEIHVNADVDNIASNKVIKKCHYHYICTKERLVKGKMVEGNYYKNTDGTLMWWFLFKDFS